MTKQSKWTIPDELKVFFLGLLFSVYLKIHYCCIDFSLSQVARELAEKASNQQPDQESGIATSALVRSAAFEPSTAPANQSSSAVGIIASSTHDGSSNSVLSGAPLPHNVENTSSSIIGMQNGGSSTAVVPVAASTEVPLVATDAGSSRFFTCAHHFLSCSICYLTFKCLLIRLFVEHCRNNDENSSLTTGADAEDGTSAEDLEVCLIFSCCFVS